MHRFDNIQYIFIYEILFSFVCLWYVCYFYLHMYTGIKVFLCICFFVAEKEMKLKENKIEINKYHIKCTASLRSIHTHTHTHLLTNTYSYSKDISTFCAIRTYTYVNSYTQTHIALHSHTAPILATIHISLHSHLNTSNPHLIAKKKCKEKNQDEISDEAAAAAITRKPKKTKTIEYILSPNSWQG